VSTTLAKEAITLEAAESAINEIETGLQDSNHIIHKMFAQKRDVVRYLADCYEVLVYNKRLELHTNQIANYLMKKIQSIDADISKVWVYDSLPAKYKTHRFNTENELSEFTDNSSLNTNYEQENKAEILFVEQEVALLKLRLSKLRTSHYTSKLEPESYRENYIIRQSSQKLLIDALDDRKTIPLNTIHLLLLCYDNSNLKYAAGEYISLLKKFGAQKKDEGITDLSKIFSPKQFGKVLRGHTRELHQSLEINTQEDAYANGFYGRKSCDNCASWRLIMETQYKNGKFEAPTLYCFGCGKMEKAPNVKLPISTPTPQIDTDGTV